MMVRALRILAVASAMAAGANAWAGLSANLFGGDFENTAQLKNEYSYDSQNNAIGAHRFNSDAATGDWGKWIGYWGPPSYEFNGYYGQGGFSTWDDPHTDASPLAKTMLARDLGNNNRSVDPYDPTATNHIMETVAFYPTMTQWVKAPTNQLTGPMQLSFDFFYNNWDPQNEFNDSFQIRVWGLDFQPTHNIGTIWSPVTNAYDSGLGSAANPLGGAWESATPNYEGKLLAQFGWGDWWTNAVGDPETNGWAHVNSTAPTQWWDDIDAADLGSVVVPVDLTRTWDYYAVSVSTRVYGESHYFYWGVNGYGITDTPAIGFDNIDLRLSVGTPVLIGDANLDGLVNALDIGRFVPCLIQIVGCGVPIQWIDINGDGVVNALDISGFVACLVNGACAGEAGGSAVPEPAGLALIGMAVLMGVWRRR